MSDDDRDSDASDSDSVVETPATQTRQPSISQKRTTAQRPKGVPRKDRETWTSRENAALIDGLVFINERKPDWKGILRLHGQGGTRTMHLAERNNVHCKDRARCQKLKWLKEGRPIPEPMRGVTLRKEDKHLENQAQYVTGSQLRRHLLPRLPLPRW
jgi:hypothetical protein